MWAVLAYGRSVRRVGGRFKLAVYENRTVEQLRAGLFFPIFPLLHCPQEQILWRVVGGDELHGGDLVTVQGQNG